MTLTGHPWVAWVATGGLLALAGVLVAWLLPRIRTWRNTVRVRFQLRPAQQVLPHPERGQVVTLRGTLELGGEGPCERFEDGEPAAVATMWGARARGDLPDKAPPVISSRAPELVISVEETPVVLKGPINVEVGSTEYHPGLNFNHLQEEVQLRAASVFDTPPAFHLDRVFTFRAIQPGDPVLARGYLEQLAARGEDEAGYRESASKWALSPIPVPMPATEDPTVNNETTALELAYEGRSKVRGPVRTRILHGAAAGLFVSSLLVLATGGAQWLSARRDAQRLEATDIEGPESWRRLAPAIDPGKDAASARLVAAFREVISSCALSSEGAVRYKPCSYPDAEQTLRRQERAIGEQRALLAYCRLLQHDVYRIRALATYRIERITSTLPLARDNRLIDPAVFTCLERKLEVIQQAPFATSLARAIAVLGTAQGKEREAIRAIERHPTLAARGAGFSALWTHGRLRVLPKLKKVILGDDPWWIKAAVIRSFHGHGLGLSNEEKKPVCDLLIPLMSSNDLRLVATAADQVAISCKRSGAVIATAHKLNKAGKLNVDFVGVLGQLAEPRFSGTTTAQKRRVVQLLRAVLSDRAATPKTRRKALQAIFFADRAAGRKLALRFKTDPEDNVRRAAEQILTRNARRPRVSGGPPKIVRVR